MLSEELPTSSAKECKKMNTNSILQKSWQMVWRYRALWLFGAILALLAANTIYLGPLPDPEKDNQWTKLKINNYSTIRVPGADMTIDFTSPGGIRLLTPNETSWHDLDEQVDKLNREASINLVPILVEAGVLLVVLLVLGGFIRYVAETAVIRMVYEGEETGRHLGVREGLRKGFSSRAGRLFLVDLAVIVLSVLAFILLFGLALAPVLLALGSQEAVFIPAGLGTLGLLYVVFCMWIAGNTLLSLVIQPVRYACVLEDQGLVASIRTGLRMTRHHLKEVGLLWLIWMGTRLLGGYFAVLIVILLAPALLLTVLAGVALGGLPAALVGLIATLFTGGVTPWIMGALAGLPVFTVVTLSPILFVGGLVEIYKSSLWTLGYRELRTMERPVQAPAPRVSAVPAQGAAG
jgi:hypothetical protein